MKIKDVFYRNHKKLLVVPLVIFVAAIIFLISFYNTNNDLFYKDVSLKGGISATVYSEKEVNIEDLQRDLLDVVGENNVRKLAEFGTDRQLGILVETSSTDENLLRSELEKVFGMELDDENFSVEVAGESLGENFYEQMIKALLFAFVFMAIVVFIRFRNFIPSFAVVFAAATDIIITIAIIDIIGVRVSTAGIAALLLLIGYSIDTDVLLTTRMMKRAEGSLMDRIESSFRTGITMTITTIVALSLGYVLTASIVLKEMFLIILVGLIVDVVMTYLMNASVLLMYMEKKNA